MEIDNQGPRGGAALRLSAEPPAFALNQHTALVARAGDSAALRCTVLRLADRAVSWVRSSDLQILTHAGAVFTADSRVSCSSARDAGHGLHAGGLDAGGLDAPPDADDILTSEEDWDPYASLHILRIERLRLSDSGRYECQINTEPKLSLFYNLTVIDTALPEVSVSPLGSSATRAALGGAARLACEARYVAAPGAQLPPAALAALPPLRLRWTHKGETLDPQSTRGGISLDTERWAGRAVSRLTLARLATGDAGRYSCAAAGASADLFVHLYRDGADDQEYDIIGGEMEMQRDQADARVSAAAVHSSGIMLTVICLLRMVVT
ncbi:uncharacterized protein LOC123698776 isoform X2 [Colias croceus]|uniref:uncharacterized protein LOC123698776 isoform X2 n=1 Tax=Colias crocea TaxID=72248 RepID=UPI001E27F559|nr:uncharacterized protein LOC123698776 isoform X2 [Colias croceus]